MVFVLNAVRVLFAVGSDNCYFCSWLNVTCGVTFCDLRYSFHLLLGWASAFSERRTDTAWERSYLGILFVTIRLEVCQW
jgi:hypothetical protein